MYLSTGSVLYSNLGKPMLTIVADTCGRHDTLGGACAQESNTVRYALEKRYMHSCRDNYLRACAHDGRLGKGDIGPNINFFMNVPVTADGGLTFEDGISAPGKYVDLRAEMDVIVLISNCPQLNNPCNAYNPTPAELGMELKLPHCAAGCCLCQARPQCVKPSNTKTWEGLARGGQHIRTFIALTDTPPSRAVSSQGRRCSLIRRRGRP